MKIRNGFVANSSSSSFLVRNKTTKQKTFVDFVMETYHLIYEYNDCLVNDDGYKVSEVIKEAEDIDITFKPKEGKIIKFDDDLWGTPIHHIYRLLLTYGKSKSFIWDLYRDMDGIIYLDAGNVEHIKAIPIKDRK